MKNVFIILTLIPFSSFAQSQGNDPFEIIGFKPFSEKESKTLWEEGSLVLGSQSDCIRQGIIRNGGNRVGNIGEDCVGGLMDANMGIHRNAVASFMSTFGKSSYGITADGGRVPSYMPATMKVKSKMAKGLMENQLIPQLKNMACQFNAPHGLDTNNSMDRDGFKNAHMELILAEKGIGSYDRAKAKKSLEKIGEKVCKAFNNEVGSRKNVSYSVGFGGHSTIIYSKKLNSLAEALPYVIYSNQRTKLASQDLNQSNLGSSDLGSDQLAREIILPPYYDGNRGKNLVYGGSPIKKFQGENEGPNGSAAVIAWQLCVEQTPNDELKTRDPAQLIPDGDDSPIELTNHNIGIYMPNNIVSPFPLVVENGKINSEKTKIDYSVNPDGSVKLNFSKPQFHYGPRNTSLTKEDKEQMQNAASSMRLSVKSFIDKAFSSPTSKINPEKSSFNIQSCSNKLSNQKGYKNWDTQGNLVEQEGNNKISLRELSELRSNAQAVMAKKILEKEIQASISKIDKEIKLNKATIAGLTERDKSKSALENKISYLEDKKNKMTQTDFNKVKLNILPCGEDGSNGPDPYFHSLKEKYAPNAKFPSPTGKSKSAYFTELANLSKQLKTKDVEAKLNEAKKKLAELESSSANPVQIKNQKEWVKTYEKMKAGKDSSPAYINTPVLNPMVGNYDNKFPCDMSNPNAEAKCDIIAENNKQLNSFKVESVFLDLETEKIEADEKLVNGYFNSGETIVDPGEGSMYYAAVTCTRKYKEEKKKKNKKCYSSSTGWEIPCPGSSSSGAIRQ